MALHYHVQNYNRMFTHRQLIVCRFVTNVKLIIMLKGWIYVLKRIKEAWLRSAALEMPGGVCVRIYSYNIGSMYELKMNSLYLSTSIVYNCYATLEP